MKIFLLVASLVLAMPSGALHNQGSRPKGKHSKGSIFANDAFSIETQIPDDDTVVSPLDDDDALMPYDVPLECIMLQVFDNMGRYENNDKTTVGFDWDELCDDFLPFSPWICPTDDELEEVCKRINPYNNIAIRDDHCTPKYDTVDPIYREDCIQHCVNFISHNRGNCCMYVCPDDLP